MKLLKNITNISLYTFLLILLVGSVASCKRGSSGNNSDNMYESNQDTEYEAAYKAYAKLVHYVESKDILYIEQ